MLFDPIRKQVVPAIPKSLRQEWSYYTAGISNEEQDKIIEWVNEEFDKVTARHEQVQPSGWLGSGFNWKGTPLYPIYRACSELLAGSDDDEIEEKAGQIFGLFISLTLSDYRDEKWLYVKDQKYEAHGVPIKSRIYFLPND